MPGTRRSKYPTPQVAERERAVLEARAAGYTFERIAEEVGYRDRGAAHKAYLRALRRVIAPAVAEYRDLEGYRLDRLQTAVYGPAVRDGDPALVAANLRIMERRARLYGLDHADGLDERRISLMEGQAHLIAAGVAWLLRELGHEHDEHAQELAATMLRNLGEQERASIEAPTPDDDDEDTP